MIDTRIPHPDRRERQRVYMLAILFAVAGVYLALTGPEHIEMPTQEVCTDARC